jgi:threonyl-tRNA synthetase
MSGESSKDSRLYRIRHSAAHVLAQAMLERFPEAKIAIGPPIEDGFYYDFDLPEPISEDDLAAIEKRMKEIIRGNHAFSVREITPEEARQLFKDQPYKLELIDDLLAEPDSRLTVYTQDTFTDLCRGPHVANTSEIHPDAVSITFKPPAGAYWRGDEKNKQLTRIYGTAWETPTELEEYLHLLEEVKRRDHRRIGPELELFYFDQTAPGMPYWMPRGLRVINKLIDFWRVEHEKVGYQEISTPLVNKRELYDTSGHWDYYRDDMFIFNADEHNTFCLKPMNCPNAMVAFNFRTRSYRELPLRLSDCDILHRNERSGTLHGLLRAQRFQQDDAHIFVAEDQIEAEYDNVFALIKRFYSIFGIDYRLSLSTRPEKFLGELELWEKAEAMLARILDNYVGKGQYDIEPEEGAFYGPKVDIHMKDALGRSWQMGTIQLDFQLPRRFNCTYIDREGRQQYPAVIHRVIYGSLERFLGILIEHTAGALPLWLAPEQARIIPITDRHVEYANAVRDRLRSAGIHADVDTSSERMGAKIRSAQLYKVPYMLIVGDREMQADAVSVRLRSEEDLGARPVAAVIERMQTEIADKRM